MCVKFNLNFGPYTYEVTIMLMVHYDNLVLKVRAAKNYITLCSILCFIE